MKRNAFFILLVLAACHKPKVEPPTPTYPVSVSVAEQKEAAIFLEALGHVEAITSVQIRSRVEGELTGVYFTQGQEVKKGDLLFTIDSRPYEASFKQAKATFEQNAAALALAEEKVKRYRLLAKEEYYSQMDFETLQANFASAKALVAQNEAQVEKALLDLNYCKIYAPIDGLTGALQIDQGNLITDAGDPLVTVNQMSPIYVTFSLPEFQLSQVQKHRGQNSLKLLATFDDFTQDPFVGELFMIDNAIDSKTGMIQMKGLFNNEKKALWPGQFIRVRLILYSIPSAVVIPYAAIQLTQKEPIVFVLKEDNTVSQRRVKLGQREDDQIVILEGVKVGEKIVTEGQLNLSEGVKVYLAEDS
jgi:membrane fusion protein, multidrug efflux system